MQAQLETLENELAQDNIAYETALQVKAKLPALPKDDKEFIYQQIAVIDPAMRDKLAQRDQLIDRFQTMITEEQILPNNSRYQAAQLNIQYKRADIENYAREFLRQHPDRINADGPTILKNKRDAVARRVAERASRNGN